MATTAQINANRVNAQRSTGPRTEEGKAKSSRNHLSHGFLSNTKFLIGEDAEEFFALLNDFTGEYQPATPTEQVFVEDMAHNRWVSGRAIRIQHDLLNRNYQNQGGELAIGPDVDRHLPLFLRYQTTADRAFHRAHTELVKAQKQRKNSEIGFESKKPVTAHAEAQETPAAPQKIANPPIVMPNPAPESPAVLDFYRIAWEYEPRSFPIQWDKDGHVSEAFTPDFYLPEFDLFVELTTMKQAHVTKKNRKVRLLREIYPHVNIQVFYQKDFENLMFKYGLVRDSGQEAPHR